jgi:hypothetical protein
VCNQCKRRAKAARDWIFAVSGCKWEKRTPAAVRFLRVPRNIFSKDEISRGAIPSNSRKNYRLPEMIGFINDLQD